MIELRLKEHHGLFLIYKPNPLLPNTPYSLHRHSMGSVPLNFANASTRK